MSGGIIWSGCSEGKKNDFPSAGWALVGVLKIE